jgi:hypothetical protein
MEMRKIVLVLFFTLVFWNIADAGTVERTISCYGTPGIGITRCFADGQIVSAHLKTDASTTGASCQSFNSWGFQKNWIWVTGDCSGVFEVSIARGKDG